MSYKTSINRLLLHNIQYKTHLTPLFLSVKLYEKEIKHSLSDFRFFFLHNLFAFPRSLRFQFLIRFHVETSRNLRN